MSEEKKVEDRASQTFAYLSDAGRKRFQKEALRHQKQSRRVKKIRVVLPILGTILLLALFVWPMFKDKQLVEIIEDSASQVEMEALTFNGVDEKGQPFSIKAIKAIHSTEDFNVIDLVRPEGSLQLNSGRWIYAEAKEGRFDQPKEKIDLKGDVLVYQDEGYEVRTDETFIDLSKGTAYSNKKVEIQGAIGWITGQGYRIYDNGAVIVITGPAHLEYTDQSKGKD